MGIASRKKDGPTPTDFGGLTLPGAFKAATDTVEKDTDSAWALWQEANAKAEGSFAAPLTAPMDIKGDRRYAKTVPGALAAASEAPAASQKQFVPHAKCATVEDAMIEARKNNRVCPKPARWQQVYDMLPDKEQGKPAPPLIAGAWTGTPSLAKRVCLREHLDWAAARGALDPVLNFLKELPEDEWHHMGD